MREKILEALQILEVGKETAFLQYQDEMSSLSHRAAANPQVPTQWLLDPKRLGWALEKQYTLENSAEVKSAESRNEFFNSIKRKL
jgi:hypothetical protein